MYGFFRQYGLLTAVVLAVIVVNSSMVKASDDKAEMSEQNTAEQSEYYIPMDFSNGVDTAFEDVSEDSNNTDLIAENQSTTEQPENVAETGKMAMEAIVEGIDNIASEVSNALSDIAPAAGGENSGEEEEGNSGGNSTIDFIEIEEYREEMNDMDPSTEQQDLSP